MPSVIVSQVKPSVGADHIKELFSFCGKIDNIEPKGTGTFEVSFKLEKAMETALLLDDAELEGSAISVVASNPPTYESSGAVPGDHKVQNSDRRAAEEADAEDNGDILQEEKPKLAVLAQLLASGYKVSDQLIAKAIDFDKKQGISASFLAFINDLDARYIHSKDPESVASKNLEKANVALGDLTSKLTTFANLRDVQNYIDKAAATRSGLRIHRFYKDVTKEIQDVHAEANRLYNLQKQQEQQKQRQKQEESQQGHQGLISVTGAEKN